jgi:hypothetical protein
MECRSAEYLAVFHDDDRPYVMREACIDAGMGTEGDLLDVFADGGAVRIDADSIPITPFIRRTPSAADGAG